MKLIAFTSFLLPILLAPKIASQLANAFQDNSLPQPPALSSTLSRNIILEGSKSSLGQRNLICTTPGSCFDDCGTYHSDCTKDLDPLYHFCNNIGDEWTCSQRPEVQTSSANSVTPSNIFPISASTPLGLLRQRSLAHSYDGHFEAHQDEDTQQETESEPTLSTNITMQVRQVAVGCDPENYLINTCCGPQQENCGATCPDCVCKCKGWSGTSNNCICIEPIISGGSSLHSPRIFTLPGHILHSIILALSSSSLNLLGIFSIPGSLFQSTLLTLSNTTPALAKEPDEKQNLKRGTSDVDCGTGHLVCLAGYHCKNVGKDNYACSGTSSQRSPRIFFILSLPFQIILSMFGSMKTLV
jgi:hypothetical protein